MEIAFEASRVSVEGSAEFPLVLFTFEAACDPHQLEFTRDPQDGQVVLGSDLLGPIDAVGEVRLTPTRVVVVVYGCSGSEDPDTPREFVVGYHATSEERLALRRAMKRIFRGTGLFIDDAATGLGLLRAIVIGPPTPTSELLVVPTYLTVVGAIMGGVMAGQRNPWLTPVGILLGAAGGFGVGFLKRKNYYGLHKYQE